MITCQVDTCGEATADGEPREAVVWVAQGVEIDDIKLVAVCGAHADGWYDGCDETLPRVLHPILPR